MQNPIHYLRYKSQTTPNDLCLVTLSQSLNYKDIYSLIAKIVTELKELDLKKGDLLISSFSDPTLDILITLSGFQMGLITSSLHGGLLVPTNIKPDLIITDNKIARSESNILKIDMAWLHKILNNKASLSIENYEKNDLIRLIFSSGTTGISKAIPISYQVFQGRLFNGLSYWVYPGKEMNLQLFSTVGGFFTTMDRLHLGLPIYTSTQPFKLAVNEKIQAITGSPIQISKWLETLEISNTSINHIQQLTISGGMITNRLYQRIAGKLTHNIKNVYGSTEVGGISSFSINSKNPQFGIGFLLPDIEAEVIKEDEMSEDGILRIRSPHMVNEYFNDIETSSAAFKDGWFYPGDRGVLDKNGMLKISGRNSELINIGGVKVSPHVLDLDILEYPGIIDAACFSVENKQGINQVACAFVANQSFDLKKLYQYLLKKHGKTSAPSAFFELKKIPRNHMGKVMRAEMTLRFTKKMQESS